MSKRVYLAGSIQFSALGGNVWRDKIKKDLESLGWEVYDPTDKEDTKEVTQVLHKLVLSGQWNKFDRMVEEIQTKDKEMVLNSDLVILLWNTEIKMYGSFNEIIWCQENKIPIYSVITGSLSKESTWALRLLRKTKIFNSLNNLAKYIERNKK